MDVDEDVKEDIILNDFGKPWPGSDIIFRCADSDKLIHFSRRLLATYSPYFEALFFHNWNDKDADILSLEEEYDMILDVFHIISNGGVPYSSKFLKPKKLMKMYKFSDRCDIKVIREICKEQLGKQQTHETLEVAMQLGMEELKDSLLESLERKDLLLFLNTNDSPITLSKKDLKLIIDRVSSTTDASAFLRASPSVVFLPSRAYFALVSIKNVSEETLACRLSPWLSRCNCDFTFVRPGNAMSVRVYRNAALPSNAYEVDFIRVECAKGNAKDAFNKAHPNGTLSIPVEFD